jgi:hypothetical protein
MSLMIMARAHEESKMKSFRLKEAWKNKRKEASSNGKKVTAQCPAWLKLSGDRRSFKVIPEVAQVVNWIFRLKLEGKGAGEIERILNAGKDIWRPPPRGAGKKFSGGWRRGYINAILTNRAVIGELTLHRRDKENGKTVRTPEGDPIPDYYPAIVDRDLFNQVQAIIRHNRETSGRAGGRPGPINNLFSHIARCAYCGGPMAYVGKGKPPNGKYLVCDTARRGMGCKRTFLRYEKFFEPLILSYCKGLDPTDILPGNDEAQSELATLKKQLQATEEEIAQKQAAMDKLLDNLELGVIVKDRLMARQGEKASLEAQREDLIGRIAKLSGNGRETKTQLESIQELITKMAEMEGQERADLRLNLRGHLRRLLDEIRVYPDKGWFGLFFKTGETRGLTVKGDGEFLKFDGKREWKHVPMFFKVDK